MSATSLAGPCAGVRECVLHLDVDAFFASVEQRDDPRLRGRPVAVGTGVVASCSYEARGRGVRTGMRLTEARRCCPSLRVLPGDYRRYEQAARRVLAICQDQTPRVELAGLDDLYLDLAPVLPAPDRPAARAAEARRIALTLAAQVRDEVGLSVSQGLGTSKLVARVATHEAKRRRGRKEDHGAPPGDPPSSVIVVPAGGERVFLAPWPVRVLPGVGPKLLARLERLNVGRVGEVAAMPLPVLCGLFGARGRVLRDQALGIDSRPVEPAGPAGQPQSVSRRTSFDPPTSDRAFLEAMLDHLVERAALWMRLRGLCSRGLALTLRYGDYRSADGRVSFARPTDDEGRLREAARARLARLYDRRLPLRLVGVELGPLRRPDRQPELFPDPTAERARRLAACKDAVRQRFGFMALFSGSALVLAGRLEHDRENFRLRTPCLSR
jgi:DNA polymerase-4